MTTRLIILGATGSVGQSAADVVEQHRDKIAVEGLVAHRQVDALWEMADRMRPRWIGLTDVPAAQRLKARAAGTGIIVRCGLPEVLEAIREGAQSSVLAAMSGFAGLLPALEALKRGMPLLLANKETLVAAGDLVLATARKSGAPVIPVDSEHSAIYQCLALPQPVRRVVLTCSGGPFRGWTKDQLHHVTVADALNHPNWDMGKKITIDSATLMNKGLEVIEAHHLFGMDYDQIDVVIHPQSVVHSLVEFVDGATMAQMGWPDMRVPIQVALSWPERWPLDVPPLDLTTGPLTFAAPDVQTFPALNIAKHAGRQGGIYPTVLNAANEVAVHAFLAEQISFLGITETVSRVLDSVRENPPVDQLDVVLEADRWARDRAGQLIRQMPIHEGGTL